MFVEIFSICDAATDYGGRLNLLGTFEGIASAKAPIVRDRCSVAARIRFEAREAGSHSVSTRFVDEKGEQVMPEMRASLSVKIQGGRTSGAFNFVLNINRLILPKFGLYEIQLWVDGVRQSSIPLLVAQAKERSRLRNPMEN